MPSGRLARDLECRPREGRCKKDDGVSMGDVRVTILEDVCAVGPLASNHRSES